MSRVTLNYRMSTNRSAATALVAGSLAGIVVMVLHPTGHAVVGNATAGRGNALVGVVHALAMLAQPLLVSGMLVVTDRLRVRRELAMTGLVTFAFASFAVIIAAAASGFIAPAAVRGLGGADDPARSGMMNALHYTGLLNQAFARLHVLFSCVAIMLWSAAMLAGRELSRALGAYGIVMGAALLAAVFGAGMRLDIHGYGLVVLAQASWFTRAALVLRRLG